MELEKTATGQGGSWGSWLTGWTSWGGYEGESVERGSKNIGSGGKVTFQEPVSAGTKYTKSCTESVQRNIRFSESLSVADFR